MYAPLLQVRGKLLNNAPLDKAFSTYSDAERFVAGESPSSGAETGSVRKYYAVKNGKTPGIYVDWSSTQEQITGVKKPVHRSFTTRAEAQHWLDADLPKVEGGSETQSVDGITFFTTNGAESPLDATIAPSASKKRKNQTNGKSKSRPSYVEYNEDNYVAGFGPLPPGAVDGFDPNIKLDEAGQVVYKTEEERQATKLVPSDIDETQPIRIHTDGSSLGNGQAGAFAGIGVYFGPGDRRYNSRRLHSSLSLLIPLKGMSPSH